MTERLNAEKAVRRSIEAALLTVIDDMRLQVPDDLVNWGPPALKIYGTPQQPAFPIWWPNIPFGIKADEVQDGKPPLYVRVSHHPVTPRVRTVGENPRVLLRGHTMIGCFVPLGRGEDMIDNLANAVMSAYPYASVFTREGFDTHLENVDPKPAFASNGRYYKPVHINWNCWRTTP